MVSANKTHDIKIEKMIALAPAQVFKAIGEGRLFLNCGAENASLKIDFKVGGKYSILFDNYGMKNQGEFLEIVADKKIVFTWCQDYETNPTPDTTVSIDLQDVGGQTSLTLTHTGFSDLENKEGHEGGWTGGIKDLVQEMAAGKLRMVRKLPIAVEKLYAACKNPTSLFGFKGELLKSVENEKIVFKCATSPTGEPLTRATQVTLLVEADDEDEISWIEVIHEGLMSDAQQKSHRDAWESQLKRLM